MVVPNEIQFIRLRIIREKLITKKSDIKLCKESK